MDLPDNEDYRDKVCTLLKRLDFPNVSWSLKEKLDGRELVLYGAGEGSHLFVETVMAIHGIYPSLVLDKRFKVGDDFYGIAARPPDDSGWSESRRRSSLVVIASGVPFVAQEMESIAIALGFGEVIQMMSIYEIHQPFSEPDELAQEGYKFFTRQESAILKAYDGLEDEQSRAIFWGVLRNHCLRTPEPLPMRQKEEHNLPQDLPFTINYSRYLCGGCDAGHLKHLLNSLQHKIQRMIVVDPMICGAQTLMTRTEFTLTPCALDQEDAILPFTKTASVRGTTYGCRLHKDGETFARTTRIDTIVGSLSPTFISMDIEGAELRALKGATNTLRTNKPTLAICVYHAVDHLWTIINHIQDLSLNYRFWIRNYSSFTAETVVYAHRE